MVETAANAPAVRPDDLLAICLEVVKCLRPLVRLPVGVFLRQAVAFLNTTNQLILLASDRLPIAVGQLAPLFARISSKLLPLPLDLILIHGFPLDRSKHRGQTRASTMPETSIWHEFRNATWQVFDAGRCFESATLFVAILALARHRGRTASSLLSLASRGDEL